MPSPGLGPELFPGDIFNLADIVLRIAREDPGRIAVVDLDGWEGLGARRYVKHTYAELSADVESVAVGLREMGIAERTRVVFMSPPSYETCVMGVALTIGPRAIPPVTRTAIRATIPMVIQAPRGSRRQRADPSLAARSSWSVGCTCFPSE